VNSSMADLIIPERFQAAHYKGLHHYLETGEGPLLRKRIETVAKRKNGEEFPIELSISPLERHGEPLFVGFLRDITDRRRRQQILEREARQAVLLHQMTSLAAETESVPAILQLCLDAVCELTGWPVGHAYIPSENGSVELVPTAIWHVDQEKYEGLHRVTMSMRFQLGIGLPGKVAQTKEAQWVPDLSRPDANFPRFRALPTLGVSAAFGIPIKSGDVVIAVLEFFTDVVTQIDPQVLRVAQTFGDQIGRVLERREVQRRRELLVAELNHRVKNMLTVIMAISVNTGRSADSLPAFQKSFNARLTSLARSYSLLTGSEWKDTAFRSVLEEIVSPHVTADCVRFDGPEWSLSPKATLAMSMILHELVTNAIKYGALSVANGKIEVQWEHIDPHGTNEIRLEWRESGLTDLQAPRESSGFGSKLIEATVRHEFGGFVDRTFRPEGLSYRFHFPARRLVEQ
jgi:two-component sensor histidine kinase